MVGQPKERRKAIMDVDFILKSTGGRLLGLPKANSPASSRQRLGNAEFTGVSTDSRTIKRGEAFVALRGDNFDGHKFVDKVFERGASAAVIEDASHVRSRDKALIQVDSTLKALGDMALAWRRRFSNLRLAAITGSNGKTTTKEMAWSMVSLKHDSLRNRDNLNNLIGLPLTLFRLNEGYESAVVELGMSDFGEISRLSQIARPDIGTITNIGRAHLEKLGGIEGVAKAKGELIEGFDESCTLVVNADDLRVMNIANSARCQKIFFGIESKAASRGLERGERWITAKNIQPEGLSGVNFVMSFKGQEVPLRLRAIGVHNVMNALCAAGLALALGCGADDVSAGIERFSPKLMRLEVMTSPQGFKLINDSYNANPDSMRCAIDELLRLKGDGRTIAVLGDMLELGVTSESEHRAIGEYMSSSGVDLLIAYGEFADAVIGGLNNGANGFRAQTREEAREMLISQAVPDDLVLVKGSRGMRMEEVIKGLFN